MAFNIPKSDKKRVVIVGGGFGGLKLANKLKNSDFQVVLIDRNNYHQFPPLIYQVASAGIEPSSISFPFRKLFHGRKDFYFRMAEVRSVFTEQNILQTSIGKISYDYLVFAAGTTTNFFGNKNVEEHAIPMKNVSEAMGLRNALLENFERALTCSSETERQELLNVVIVGGGATGVEVAGALSEMKNFVLPKDYPDMPSSLMNIYRSWTTSSSCNESSHFCARREFLAHDGCQCTLEQDGDGLSEPSRDFEGWYTNRYAHVHLGEWCGWRRSGKS